jgi:hypothetical protein
MPRITASASSAADQAVAPATPGSSRGVRSALAAAALGTVLFATSAVPALAASPTLSPTGVGVVKIGMTANAATGALPPGIIITDEPAGGHCQVWEAKGYLPSSDFMSTSTERLSYVSGNSLTTTKGIEVGSTLAAVKKAYGSKLKPAAPRPPEILSHVYRNYVVSGKSYGYATYLQISVRRSTGKVGLLRVGTTTAIRSNGCA